MNAGERDIVDASAALYRAKNAHSKATSENVAATWHALRAASREWRRVLCDYTGERAHYAAFDDAHEGSGGR